MGVRGLTTFLKEGLKAQNIDGHYTISIREEIQRFQEDNGRDPLIVIDLMALYSLAGKEDARERLLGGRHQLYVPMYEHLFTTLKRFGAELVFFIDGPSQKVKENETKHRGEEKHDWEYRVLDEIYKKRPIEEIIQEQKREVRLFEVRPTLTKVAKKFGEVHTSIKYECDLEIAAYACKNKALAVIGNDSDYLIYPGNWYYWSGKDIDLSTFTTTEYDRKALRYALRLDMDQMPLFATLGGNDILAYDNVKDFHHQIAPNGGRFWKIASFIRRFPRNLSEQEIRTIAKQVFGDGMTEELVQKIIDSLLSYDVWIVNDLDRVALEDFEQKLLREDKDRLYAVLKGIKYVLARNFIDLRCEDLPNKFDVVRPILKRLFGIVLKHLNDPTITRSIKWSGETYEETPEYPEGPVPPVEVLLLNENFEEGDELYETRFQLLFWAISPSMDPQMFRHVNPDYLHSLLVLHVLWETKLLSHDELDLLLLTVNAVIQKKIDEELEIPSVVDPRMFRICHFFINLFSTIESGLVFTGLSHLLRPLPFDAVYFHVLSQEWAAMDDDQKLAKLENVQEFRFYASKPTN